MDFTIGPKPSATEVPLDTAITKTALSSAALDDLRLAPEVPISHVGVEVTGTLCYQRTFYPAQFLPGVRDNQGRASFMEIHQNFRALPSLDHLLFVGLAIQYGKKRANEPLTPHYA
jgi:hypothetical protein